MKTVTGVVKAVSVKDDVPSGLLIGDVWYNKALKKPHVFKGVRKGDTVTLSYEQNGQWLNVEECTKTDAVEPDFSEEVIEPEDEEVYSAEGRLVALKAKSEALKKHPHWNGARVGMAMNLAAARVKADAPADVWARAVVKDAITLLETMDAEGLP